jgi:succinate dehydrogenase / fumarate reductase cytochrome b subunit
MTRYTLLTSILNRATGLVLSLALILLVYWLNAVASGPGEYARALAVLGHPAFLPVYLAVIVAFSYHLVAGIRHLIWDTGHGVDRVASQRSALVVALVSAVLIAGLISWAFAGRAAAFWGVAP